MSEGMTEGWYGKEDGMDWKVVGKRGGIVVGGYGEMSRLVWW